MTEACNASSPVQLNVSWYLRNSHCYNEVFNMNVRHTLFLFIKKIKKNQLFHSHHLFRLSLETVQLLYTFYILIHAAQSLCQHDLLQDKVFLNAFIFLLHSSPWTSVELLDYIWIMRTVLLYEAGFDESEITLGLTQCGTTGSPLERQCSKLCCMPNLLWNRFVPSKTS